MGTDLQDAIVHHFADMGRAVGHWKCTACGKVHQFCKRPGKCENCGCKGFKPEEVRFQSAISGASCGVDMLVQLGGPKLFPVELKTMIKDQFAELVAPLQEHRLRTNLYLRLISESEQPWSNLVSTEEARVLYVCKGGGYYGGGAGAATWRDEPDGTASLGLQNPYNWHGYLGVNPLSNQANIQAVHVRTRVRLIGTAAAINNAVWLVHAGADYYPQYGDPGFIIPAVAISRPRLLTGSWQDISMTTLSDVGHQEPGGGITAAQLAANPPPYN